MISAISGSVSTKDPSISCELSVFESLDSKGKGYSHPGGTLEARMKPSEMGISEARAVGRSARRVWWARGVFMN